MPEYRDPKVTDRRTGGGGAGRWIGIIIAIIIVLALLGWIFGWFGGTDETLVETEQPEVLEGEEAVVAPPATELEAEEGLTQETEVEDAAEPIGTVPVDEPGTDADAGEAATDTATTTGPATEAEETAVEADAAVEEPATEAEDAVDGAGTTPDAPADAEVIEVPVEDPEETQ